MSRIALFLLLAAACNHPPPQPKVYGDDASDVCVRACSQLTAWRCPEGAPSPSGESCESFCTRTSAFLDAKCVADARGKGDLAACGVRCTP